VASAKGYLYPARRRVARFRVKAPRRVVVPLAQEEVRAFLARLRTWRDLSIATLMLLCGLRSREVIELRLKDLSLDQGLVLVLGKGNKERQMPFCADVAVLVRNYLERERPPTTSASLFVSLKSPRRGQPMSPAGLRSIFRHHRRRSGITKANPHRFRHTFGADMVRAGISLPVLMKLMGHSNINLTLRYVELSAKDVWEEMRRVMKGREGFIKKLPE